MLGRRTSARAISRRCRWPPEKLRPSCSTRLWMPPGRRDDVVVAAAASCSAVTTASSGIEGSHSATLSRTVPSKRKTSWSTKETEAASALRGDVLQPLPVDADGALPGAVEARDQPGDGGLAAAGAADERDLLPRPDRQREAGEQRLVERAVAEGDVLQRHMAREPAGARGRLAA